MLLLSDAVVGEKLLLKKAAFPRAGRFLLEQKGEKEHHREKSQ